MHKKEALKPLVTISLGDHGIDLKLADDISELIGEDDLGGDGKPLSREERKQLFIPVLASAIANLTAGIADDGMDADDAIDYAFDCIDTAFDRTFPTLDFSDDNEEEASNEDPLSFLPPELWQIAKYELNGKPMYQCVCLQLVPGNGSEKFDALIFRDKELAVRRCAALNGVATPLP